MIDNPAAVSLLQGLELSNTSVANANAALERTWNSFINQRDILFDENKFNQFKLALYVLANPDDTKMTIEQIKTMEQRTFLNNLSKSIDSNIIQKPKATKSSRIPARLKRMPKELAMKMGKMAYSGENGIQDEIKHAKRDLSKQKEELYQLEYKLSDSYHLVPKNQGDINDYHKNKTSADRENEAYGMSEEPEPQYREPLTEQERKATEAYVKAQRETIEKSESKITALKQYQSKLGTQYGLDKKKQLADMGRSAMLNLYNKVTRSAPAEKQKRQSDGASAVVVSQQPDNKKRKH